MLETTAHLFRCMERFQKTIVDWLTGEITEGSSIREPSAVFKVQRKDGHAMLAEGFIAWSTATPPEGRAPDDVATNQSKSLIVAGFQNETINVWDADCSICQSARNASK